jgi:predicted YcjX-like family ATPase
LTEGDEGMAKLTNLYDEDFVRWTEEQAAALRQAKRSNLPLDWENLAEEIESLGRSDRRELRLQITRILRHLLKLEASPAAEPRAGWRSTSAKPGR